MGKAACDHCDCFHYCKRCIVKHEKKCDPVRWKQKKERKRKTAVVWVSQQIQKKYQVALADAVVREEK